MVWLILQKHYFIDFDNFINIIIYRITAFLWQVTVSASALVFHSLLLSLFIKLCPLA